MGNLGSPSRETTSLDELLAVLACGRRLCVFLGATDTGKTTLAFGLARWLAARGRRVGFVDSDVGQSHIGPPTTIGWAFVDDVASKELSAEPQGLYFVGATSPAGHFLPTVVGAKAMTDAAFAAGADVVLVDTTGMVSGGPARALKYWKIDLLSPTDIVAIQREAEVEHLLRPWDGRPGLAAHRLRPAREVRVKSARERAEHRRALFREHFAHAREVVLPLDSVRLIGLDANAPPLPATMRAYAEAILDMEVAAAVDAGDELLFFVNEARPARGEQLLQDGMEDGQAARIIQLGDLIGRLVSLSDCNGRLLALGVLRELDLRARQLTVRTPVGDPAQVMVVHLGERMLSDWG